MTATQFVTGTEIVFNDPASVEGPGNFLRFKIGSRLRGCHENAD
jgi:hypothetical protein